MERRTRRSRPALESLEGRQLLNSDLELGGKRINEQDLRRFVLQRQNDVPVADRRISYTTPEGSRVNLTLYGRGTLEGTTIDQDGVVDLVYGGTDATSGIIGHVSGGSGRALLRSIRDGNPNFLSQSGSGNFPVGIVNLNSFDLVPGGAINLTGGVGKLFLRSAGRDTQILLTELPESTTSSTSTSTSNSGTQIDQVISGGSTSNTTTSGAGTTALAATGNASPAAGTRTAVTNGTPAALTSTEQDEVVIVPNTNSPVSTVVVTGGNTANSEQLLGTATGIDVVIGRVDGRATTTPSLGNPQIFGYDPTANALVRFDARTGAALQAIPVTGMGTAIAGVGLGRNNGRLVVLIGDDQVIQAFDAVTGAPAGQFSLASLASLGVETVDGIGSTDTRTFLTDAEAGDNGLIVRIDVTQSLAGGQAVVTGSPFAPRREFDLAGGATGVAGSDVLYALGAAHFDTFQPDQTQFGVLAVNTVAGNLAESSRTALPGPRTFINAGPEGQARMDPNKALGSIDQRLALITSDQNTVSLYNPSTLATAGSLQLDYPNRLAGLSESFHPELDDTALVNVQGNLRSFRSNTAQGLVINDTGSLGLVQIHNAIDTTIVGRPVNHVRIPIRDDVFIYSTARIDETQGDKSIGQRGGVTVVSATQPVMGPLSKP